MDDPYISDTQPSIWHYGGDTSVTVTMLEFTPDITIADGQRAVTARLEDGHIGLYQFLLLRPPTAGNVDSWTTWGLDGMRTAVLRHPDGSAEIAISACGVGDGCPGAEIAARLPEDAATSLRDYLICGPIHDDEDDA